MPVATPTDRRFRRAHVSPTRRRGRLSLSWRLLVWALVAACLPIAGYRLTQVLLSADALEVNSINISGNRKLSRGEVLALLQPLQGRNMLHLDLDEVRRTLMTSPWVADASLRRELPGKVDVVIVERQPVAIGRFDEGLFLIDEHGNIVDEFGPNHADFDLPIVDGLAPERGAGDGAPVDPDRASLAVRLLAALQHQPDLAARVSQIDVHDSRDAILILKGDVTLVHVGDDHFVERLLTYVELATALRERVDQIDTVDLRFGERVYVKPRTSGRGLARAMPAADLR
jgi:cell division septal protein FtsQ